MQTALQRMDRVVLAAILVGAAFSLVVGVWALFWPDSFADFAEFPPHEHFLHDIGAFQIGIGVTLLLALVWSDVVLVVLAGFLVGNTIHTISHVLDYDHGGKASDAWLLGALSVLFAVATVRRYRALPTA